MNGLVLRVLAMNEVRLRMRRLSTIVALLAVAAATWAMIGDPSNGMALIVVDNARVLYTSSALAMGSASMAAILFGLGGFYLARGRMAEDVRSGAGGVIGATAIGNAHFIAGRWLGAMAYLVALALAFMATVLACHLLHGDGPIEPLVYLSTYAVTMLPLVFFCASCAVLFDSWAPLMGKGGDVAYFFVWTAMLSVAATVGPLAKPHWWLLFDFTGLSASMLALGAIVKTGNLMVGMGVFKPELAPVVLPAMLWSGELVAMRAASALLALTPLLPAVLLFHRYSPDKVKLSSARRRRSPVTILNGWLRPLARLVQPLFALAARLPGLAGQITADIALTLAMSPAAIGALIAAAVSAALVPDKALPAIMAAAIACWGMVASDIGTRDFAAASEELTGAVRRGGSGRYARHFGAALLLGLAFTGVIAWRWALHDPLRALAAVAGVFALSACAQLLGYLSRTSRTFLALFMFGLYVALNAKEVPMLDAVGFNGAANAHSVAAYLAAGVLALAAGALSSRRE